MGWLERLDTTVRGSHWIAHAPYWALRWSLVALGAFCVVRLALDRIGFWPLY